VLNVLVYIITKMDGEERRHRRPYHETSATVTWIRVGGRSERRRPPTSCGITFFSSEMELVEEPGLQIR
jgi:hypothetical protein